VQTEEKEQARKYVQDKKEDTKQEDEEGCMPAWISSAPLWLKLVISFSAALLIGAVILIGVGASLAMDKMESSNVQNPAPPETASPVAVPAPPTTKTLAPSASMQQTTAPIDAPTLPPSISSATDAPTSGRIQPQNPGTPASTVNSTVINFFAMAGRFDDDELPTLIENLQSLPNMDGNTILFHLGDWNSPYATSCVESSCILCQVTMNSMVCN
jgi:hypothetical protein